MPRNILGYNSNESRPSAEVAHGIHTRLSEINAAADYEHASDLRVFPNLLAEDRAPVIVVPKEVTATPLPIANVVSTKVAGNVIDFAKKRLTHEENEKLDRERLARQASEEAYDAAA